MLTAFVQRPLPSDFSLSSSTVPNTDSAGPSRSQGFAVELTPLQNSIIQKLDPNRLLCRFESSGAGKCQDRHCEDYHWSDLELSGEFLILMNPEGSPQIRVDDSPYLCFQMMYLLNSFSNRTWVLQIIIMEKSRE